MDCTGARVLKGPTAPCCSELPRTSGCGVALARSAMGASRTRFRSAAANCREAMAGADAERALGPTAVSLNRVRGSLRPRASMFGLGWPTLSIALRCGSNPGSAAVPVRGSDPVSLVNDLVTQRRLAHPCPTDAGNKRAPAHPACTAVGEPDIPLLGRPVGSFDGVGGTWRRYRFRIQQDGSDYRNPMPTLAIRTGTGHHMVVGVHDGCNGRHLGRWRVPCMWTCRFHSNRGQPCRRRRNQTPGLSPTT